MYSDRNVTGRPLTVHVIVGITLFYYSSYIKLWALGCTMYMYIVVRHIVKDVSHSSACASLGGDLWATLQYMCSGSTCIESQPRPPTASLSHGRQLRYSGVGRKPQRFTLLQIMHLTQDGHASVWLFITSQSHLCTLLSDRRCFAGR